MKRTFKVFASKNQNNDILSLLYPIHQGSEISIESHGSNIWVWVADIGAYIVSKVGANKFQVRHLDSPDLGVETYDSEGLTEWAERVYQTAKGWN